jgi:hypothetical protein
MKPEQIKMKLGLASPIDMPEVKIMLKEVFQRLDVLENEIRKLSENRTRVDRTTGKNVQAS